jgi:hypothetical protein
MLVWKEGERLQQESGSDVGKSFAMDQSSHGRLQVGLMIRKDVLTDKRTKGRHESSHVLNVLSAAQCVQRASKLLRKKCCGRYPRNNGERDMFARAPSEPKRCAFFTA